MMGCSAAAPVHALRRMRASTRPEVQQFVFLGDAERWFEQKEAFASVRTNAELRRLVACEQA